MSLCGSGFRVAEREEAPNFGITIKIEAELKQFPRAKAVVFSSVSRCQWYTRKTAHGQVLKPQCRRKNGNTFFFSLVSRCSWWKRGEVNVFQRENVPEKHWRFLYPTYDETAQLSSDRFRIDTYNFSLNFGKLSFILWGKHAFSPSLSRLVPPPQLHN